MKRKIQTKKIYNICYPLFKFYLINSKKLTALSTFLTNQEDRRKNKLIFLPYPPNNNSSTFAQKESKDNQNRRNKSLSKSARNCAKKYLGNIPSTLQKFIRSWPKIKIKH